MRQHVGNGAISNGCGEGELFDILMSFHPLATLVSSCQLDMRSAAKKPDPQYTGFVCCFCKSSLGAHAHIFFECGAHLSGLVVLPW